MKVAILGYGSQGQSSYKYWRDGNEITVCDQNTDLELPEGVNKQLGEDYLRDLDKFDLLVRSPSIHPRDIIGANSSEIAEKITSNTNEFFRVCPTKNVIGVTGTKGKGTTSTLIAKMLEASGQKVHLGGNIGTPPLDLLKENIQPDDWVVLELANFQLIDLNYSPLIGVCLMVVPEHLNWHADMAEYLAAKSQLFARQTDKDIAIYFNDNKNSRRIAGAGNGQKIPYFAAPGALVENDIIKIGEHEICKTGELKLLGKHNWQNACAATTAIWFSLSEVENQTKIEAIRQVLTTFSGLPHRIELVREADGVKFYNDSFATGLHATEAAIDAIPKKKVMILGGFERDLPLEHFGKFVSERTDQFRTILIIGQSGERLAKTLKASGYDNFTLDTTTKTMSEIVAKACGLAHPGDAVVLSPGFASFDMFKNFEERGDQFREAVKSL